MLRPFGFLHRTFPAYNEHCFTKPALLERLYWRSQDLVSWQKFVSFNHAKDNLRSNAKSKVDMREKYLILDVVMLMSYVQYTI